VYALVALGYTMVYGIIRLINFAHGDLYMIGAFAGFTLLGALGTAFIHVHSFLIIPLAFIVPMAVVGLLGVVIERVAYRPLRRAPRLSPLITAIGVSLALETTSLLVWGASFQVFPSIIPSVTWTIGGAIVTSTQVVILVVTVLLMALLYVFVQRTMMGKAMRAIAIDQDTARLMGINVDTVISITFFVGSALGAAAGIMAGTYYTEIDFNMGFIIGLKAFTAAVLGGIGNIPGAMLGGYAIGLLETVAVGWGVIGGEWRDVFVFAILILVLVFRPTGILGEQIVEKV
jgi:branched-chain amino acid transport system permease protein